MHCIDRGWERYAVRLTAADIRAMEAAVRRGQSLMVRREPGGMQVHIVMYGAMAMVAVCAPHDTAMDLWRIITFLPEEAIKKGNQDRRLLADHERNRGHRGGRHRRATARRAV